MVRLLLQVSPHMRPTCEKILQTSFVLRHIEEKHFVEADEGELSILMSTIKFPKSIKYLQQTLP
jgi:NIMA (never in mitosis gene a)-related kinase